MKTAMGHLGAVVLLGFVALGAYVHRREHLHSAPVPPKQRHDREGGPPAARARKAASAPQAVPAPPAPAETPAVPVAGQSSGGPPLMDAGLARDLSMNPDQERAMRAAIQDFLERSAAVHASKTIPFPQKKPEVDRLRDALESQFRAILDADQYATLSRARAERRAALEERRVAREVHRWTTHFGFDDAQASAFEAALRASPVKEFLPDEEVSALLARVPGLSPSQVDQIREYFETNE